MEAQVATLAARFRVTALDNRGVGRSSLPDGPFDVRDLAADAAAALDALGIAHAHVAGFSMGGAIAQELALARPEPVRSLVIVGSWARSDRLFRETITGAATTAGDAQDAEGWLRSFLPWVYSHAVYDDGRIDDLVAAALANPYPQETEAFQRTAAAILDHDVLERLPGVAAPTLVICGLEDILCPPRHGRQIAAAIPGARLVELAGQAHQPFQEDPPGFDALVLGFWDGLALSR